jgi:hypothetical protein
MKFQNNAAGSSDPLIDCKFVSELESEIFIFKFDHVRADIELFYNTSYHAI